MTMTRRRVLGLGLLISGFACQPLHPSQPGNQVGHTTGGGPLPATANATSDVHDTPAPRPAAVSVAPERAEALNPAANFGRYASTYANTTYDDLSRELGLGANENTLSFVPTETQYFDRVKEALAMTPTEVEIFRKHGVVSVDHGQHEAMGSLYYSIWSRELPVLITTDSLLHALHRSYDTVLKELETTIFFERIDAVLGKLYAEVGTLKAAGNAPELRLSLEDVDLYLTVARNLLAGAGAPDDVWGHAVGGQRKMTGEQLLVEPGVVAPARVRTILKLIAAQTMQTPFDPTSIFGGQRPIDYSQFKPRGHYEETPVLQRYFRAMMWLGRSDLGFQLTKPAGVTGWQVDLTRERRDAALMMQMLERTGGLAQLQSVSDVIDFMVGHTDNPTPRELVTGMKEANVADLAALAESQNLERWANVVNGKRQTSLIRSQVQGAVDDGTETPLATYVQLFGQRFVLDSFILSKLVYDSVIFRGAKQERMMPQGLDVMAALGNDYATQLLQPELARFNYAGNLMAARKVAQDYDVGRVWETDVYSLWLDTLRTLHQPETSQFFPQVMRTRVWAAKQLQTQLSSWAELRHDTILYAKQSYSSYPLCGYPRGYVEPYPKFFERLTSLAREAANRLSGLDVASPDIGRTIGLTHERNRRVYFFDHFANIAERLGVLAKKELRGEPFTSDEEEFLQDTVQIQSAAGSGGPRYDGWYSGLLYQATPDESAPTIADVHTNPRDNEVLEVGVGDPQFLVVAIDNGTDRATYVGPAYSYYEFTQSASNRLTDSQWEQLLQTKPPPRPVWTGSFVAPTVRRSMAGKRTRLDKGYASARRTPMQRVQERMKAEDARLRELKRVLALATSERDRAAHQRAIDAIQLAKCARTKPFPRDAINRSLQVATERAAKCFKGTTNENTCNFDATLFFEPRGKKSVVFGASYTPEQATHECVARVFDAISAPAFCGEATGTGVWVRCGAN